MFEIRQLIFKGNKCLLIKNRIPANRRNDQYNYYEIEKIGLNVNGIDKGGYSIAVPIRIHTNSNLKEHQVYGTLISKKPIEFEQNITELTVVDAITLRYDGEIIETTDFFNMTDTWPNCYDIKL